MEISDDIRAIITCKSLLIIRCLWDYDLIISCMVTSGNSQLLALILTPLIPKWALKFDFKIFLHNLNTNPMVRAL